MNLRQEGHEIPSLNLQSPMQVTSPSQVSYLSLDKVSSEAMMQTCYTIRDHIAILQAANVQKW